jgi:hypothetical protein
MGKWLCLPSLKNVNYLVLLKVHKQSSKGLTTPQGELIHTQDISLWEVEALVSLEPDEGVGTTEVAQAPTYSRCRFGAAGIRQFQKRITEPCGSPGIALKNTRKALCKDATGAGYRRKTCGSGL